MNAQETARPAPFRFGLRMTEQGVVASVGDGIAWITGLPSAAMDEVLSFEDGSRAVVFQLEEGQRRRRRRRPWRRRRRWCSRE